MGVVEREHARRLRAEQLKQPQADRELVARAQDGRLRDAGAPQQLIGDPEVDRAL